MLALKEGNFKEIFDNCNSTKELIKSRNKESLRKYSIN